MARRRADYLALALIARITEDDSFSYGEDRDFSGDLGELKIYAEERCGFPVTQPMLDEAVRSLADCGLIRITDDVYSGTFVKIKASQFAAFFQKASEESAKAFSDYGNVAAVENFKSDYPAAAALLKHELFEDYHELGDAWLKRALEGLRKRYQGDDPEAGSSAQVETAIPAADRLVEIDHNSREVQEVIKSTEAASEAIRSSNTIDESSRGWIRIHIQSGIELFKAHKILASAASALLLSPLLEAYTNVAEEPAKQAILAAIHIVRSFFGLP